MPRSVKVTVAEAEKQHAATKAHTDRQIAEIASKITGIESQLAELEAERAKLGEGVDEDLLYQYNKLFVNKGGLAVVALEHETCMGCHMKLTTQTAVRVKGKQGDIELRAVRADFVLLGVRWLFIPPGECG
jgi:predicted  nucleic acid-binding Zn-ribbon protein